MKYVIVWLLMSINPNTGTPITVEHFSTQRDCERVRSVWLSNDKHLKCVDVRIPKNQG